ncbi:hypothetical protein ACFP65_03580 [Marinilactibacillus sp. GCM10026970]|uniref:hypothetical protein n=1 Tax=Marinilactibacillus sp. GCM10026970 TaxID=3252642 RepID=UPI0036119F0B
MEISPMDVTAPLRLGRFMTYLDIVLKLSLVLLVVVTIVAIIYGVVLLKRYVQAYTAEKSMHRKIK